MSRYSLLLGGLQEGKKIKIEHCKNQNPPRGFCSPNFCQRACSQKIRRAPLEQKIRTAQVCGLRTVRIFFARFYGFLAVRKICYRPGSAVSVLPYFLFFNPPPPCPKSSTPPPLTTPACVQMGASAGLPTAVPLLIRF